MTIIVDTNIVFSAILKTDSKIAKILTSNKSKLNFVSSVFLLKEIKKHKKRILKITDLSNSEFNIILKIITKHITFIDNESITKINYQKANKLTEDIDSNDFYFVAFALQLNARLWTGDKKLYKGLQNKNFQNLIITKELQQYLYKKE